MDDLFNNDPFKWWSALPTWFVLWESVWPRLWQWGWQNAWAATWLALICSGLGYWSAIQRRPGLRQMLWLIVLCRLVMPPGFECPCLPAFGQTTTPAHHVAAAAVDTPSQTYQTDSLRGTQAKHLPLPPASAPTSLLASVALGQQLFLGWALLGTFWVLVRTAWQSGCWQEAIRQCQPAAGQLQALVQVRAAQLGVAAVPQVVIAAVHGPPLLWAWQAVPVIVLPQSLVQQLDEAALDAILCHELAHLRRRDHWVNLLGWLIVACCWWHPVAWWASRELRAAQEVGCDALVLSQSLANRPHYARTLFFVLEFLQTNTKPVPVLASGFGRKSTTQRRFEMLADKQVKSRLCWWNYLLALPICSLLFWLPTPATAEPIKLENCPEGVQKTLAAFNGIGQILEVDKQVVQGKPTYFEAKLGLNGKIYELLISEAGSLWSIKFAYVSDKSKPEPGAGADEKLKPAVKAKELEKIVEKSKRLTWDDLPAAVRKTLEREANGGEIEAIEAEIYAGEIFYEAEIEYETEVGELTYEVVITVKGKLLKKYLEEEDEASDPDEVEKAEPELEDKSKSPAQAQEK